MIKTIIVDDDLYHTEALTNLLTQYFKQVEIIATCQDVPNAVKKIDELRPHLVFLDIEMEPYTGFDVLEMVNERDFEVIFTTAYQHYAVQAIKASALDYIEKPLNKNDLAEALMRYKTKTGNIKMANLLANFKLDNEGQKIALYDKGGLSFFEIRKIVRCQSDNTYTEFFIHHDDKKQGIIRIEVSKGMAYFEDFLLGKGCFFRIHNQHLVNIYHIKRYAKEAGGYLVMDDQSNTSIPIARARKEDFLDFLRLKGIVI
ncbi:MAG TPA: response regulator transcription factor [Bacteroidales bacterium]|nr:response regulator transcription factor [Bacteroidales bacterium]